MAAPTEEEIRSALDAQLARHSAGTVPGGIREQIASLIEEVAEPMLWPCEYVLQRLAEDPIWGPDEPPEEWVLYWALSRAEAKELRKRMRAATKRAAVRCEAIVLEEMTAAAVAFATAHPDAPRPAQEAAA